MGHSTPTVTANIYSDLYADELDQVATNLDQLHATEIQTPQDRTRTGRIKPTIECITRVDAGQTWWPGPGSNRRPSAFQSHTSLQVRAPIWLYMPLPCPIVHDFTTIVLGSSSASPRAANRLNSSATFRSRPSTTCRYRIAATDDE